MYHNDDLEPFMEPGFLTVSKLIHTCDDNLILDGIFLTLGDVYLLKHSYKGNILYIKNIKLTHSQESVFNECNFILKKID